MRALILAAGRGKRMGQSGRERPKCLIELAGMTLLERQIAALRSGGVEEIGVVRGYRAQMLNFPGLTYFDNERWAQTNMVMSLAAASSWLRSGPVIVSYADIFYRSELVRALVEAPGALLVTYDRAWRQLWTRRFADPLSDAETFRIDAGGNLLEIGGRTTLIDEIEGQYMGLLKFTPAAWSSVAALLATLDAPTRDALDMTGLLRRLLAASSIPIGTLGTDGQWGEIDNPEDLALYERMTRDGELVQPEAVALAARLAWDYTEHASHYDRRADYCPEAIDQLLATMRCGRGTAVADIGAGTGKLTKELLKRGLTVSAVEPNDAMREIGIGNTRGQSVAWSVGTAEASGLPANGAHAVFFGSSFNVVDQAAALAEARRILSPQGWFACLWNHRNLDDPIQQIIESIIKSFIPSYRYGSRREDPTAVIDSSGYFLAVQSIEGGFVWPMSSADIVVAWRSHATLRRQAGDNATFERIIAAIAASLAGLPETIAVPYTTRSYFCQARSGSSRG
jgi:choline kinase/ubiquinone/menaquinone biosynthesis C-methylase UbiE